MQLFELLGGGRIEYLASNRVRAFPFQKNLTCVPIVHNGVLLTFLLARGCAFVYLD